MHDFYLEVGETYNSIVGRKAKGAFRQSFIEAMKVYVPSKSRADKILSAGKTVAILVQSGFLDREKLSERPITEAEGALVAISGVLKSNTAEVIEILKKDRKRADNTLWLTVERAEEIRQQFKKADETRGNKNGRGSGATDGNASATTVVDLEAAVSQLETSCGLLVEGSTTDPAAVNELAERIDAVHHNLIWATQTAAEAVAMAEAAEATA
jgi:predicted transcriptional regulator